MRGRNRGSKGPNPLTRSYESNGPDVKVRGTAQHIAEKYTQLARDAQSSGDPVAAENYLQHAEHYFRIILTAQEQLRQQFGTTFQRPFDDEDEDGDDFNGGYGQPGQGGGYGAPGDDMDIGSQPQPYTGGFEARQGGDEGRRERFDRGPRPDRGDRPDRQDRGDRPDRGDRQERGERQDRGDRPDRGDRSDRAERPEGQPRFDRGPRQDRRERFRDRERDQQPRGEFQPREPRPERVEAQGEAPEGFAPRREERRDDRREGRRERRPEAPVEEAGLPAFLTNPVRAAPVAEAPEAAPAPAPEAEAAEAPRPRRRRRTTRVDEAPDSGAETRDTTPVE